MKAKILYCFIFTSIFAIKSTFATEIIIDGTVTKGSSMGLISNGSEDYSYASTTKNIEILAKACPLSMGTETRCIVKFDEQNGSITKIISARRPPSSAQPNPQITQAPERSTPPRRPEWKDAFSRRNYQLGMTLSEFRSTSYPDQKEWPGAYPVCSNETSRISKFPISVSSEFSYFSFKDVGVTKCALLYSSSMGVMIAGLMLGSVSPAYNEFLFMRPKNGSEPVLFEIAAQFPTANFPSVVESIQDYYGPPSKSSAVDITTGVGIQLKGQVVNFTNSSSHINVRQYANDIRRGSITYILNDIADEVLAANKRLTQRPGPP